MSMPTRTCSNLTITARMAGRRGTTIVPGTRFSSKAAMAEPLVVDFVLRATGTITQTTTTTVVLKYSILRLHSDEGADLHTMRPKVIINTRTT